MLRGAAFVLASVVAFGCGDNGRPNFVDPTTVRVEAEPSGDNCPYGGTVIHSGLDRDNDGYLDDAEIQQSEYICDASTTVRCLEDTNNAPGPVTLHNDADFAAIADLNCIDGDLMIVGTDLVEMPQLPNLLIVTGSVVVAGNAELVSLDGLRSLRQVGRKYVAQGNDSLTSVAALGELQRFQGIAIIGNDSLLDLRGMEALKELDGGLQISNNTALVSLEGLDNVIRGLREKIIIASNKNLTSVDALRKLQSAVVLEFTGNASLTSISLPSLEKLDTYLLVKDHASLTTVNLPTFFTSGGFLFRSNPALTQINVPELVLSGSVVFEQNTTLASIDLPKLAYTTGDFDVLSSPQLVQTRVESLVAIGGRMFLYKLPALTNLAGFEQLSSVGGNFTIQDSDALANFTGLAQLVDVANMTITQNAQLSSFDGLVSFDKVGGDLMITSNSSMQISTAEAFATSITVVGSVTIN